MVIVPPLVRFLGQYYHREVVSSFLAEEEETINCEEPESETSDDLHLHLTIASCLIRAASFLILVTFMTNQALIFCKSP